MIAVDGKPTVGYAPISLEAHSQPTLREDDCRSSSARFIHLPREHLHISDVQNLYLHKW
jgi:hypothetical protein